MTICQQCGGEIKSRGRNAKFCVDCKVNRPNKKHHSIWVAYGKAIGIAWPAILEKFDNRCAYCRRPGEMTVDHVIPRSKGGENEPSNIVPCCGSCNSVKGKQILSPLLGIELMKRVS